MVTEDDAGAPGVLVAVVTYNSEEHVEGLLSALPSALGHLRDARVVVVDNGSRDRTLELVRRHAPNAVVLQSGANIGYGAAINRALAYSRPRTAVLVLNPDLVPAPGALAALVERLERPGVGVAVPRIVDTAGRLKFSLRREPTLLRAVGEAVLGGHRAARHPALGDMVRDTDTYVDGATADWATGAVMAISRPVLDALGGWDESFFLYSEETDYALRARDAGFALSFVSDAEVVHPGGEMSRSPMLWSMLAVNRVRLYRRRHGPVASGAYWLVVLLNEGARALLGRPTHRAAVRALFRGPVYPSDAVVGPAR